MYHRCHMMLLGCPAFLWFWGHSGISQAGSAIEYETCTVQGLEFHLPRAKGGPVEPCRGINQLFKLLPMTSPTFLGSFSTRQLSLAHKNQISQFSKHKSSRHDPMFKEQNVRIEITGREFLICTCGRIMWTSALESTYAPVRTAS